MRALMRLLGIWAVLAAFTLPAAAQLPGGVTQQGNVVADDCVKWVRNGVIADTGSACGSGGGGSPGGSNTQVQYNNSGSFGGITGATTNGTALTLVAPVLGTPASGTLTNTTGFPVANLAGAGTGVLAAAANPVNATSGFATYVLGSSSAFGLVKVDGTTITASTGVISAAPLTVTTSTQTGSNYAFLTGDQGKVVYLNNASAQIPTIAQAGTTGFATGWYVQTCNIGAGTQTITPATSTIGGAATYVLQAAAVGAPKCVTIISDGTNYLIFPEGGQLNGTQSWSGTNTFGPVVGTVSTQSGTTYTLAAADCGTMVRFTNASAVTVTIPQGLAIGCNIAIEQTTAAGQVSVNGSAVTPATLHSAHSYTKTFGQWAIIGVSIESSNVAILTGDGA